VGSATGVVAGGGCDVVGGGVATVTSSGGVEADGEQNRQHDDAERGICPAARVSGRSLGTFDVAALPSRCDLDGIDDGNDAERETEQHVARTAPSMLVGGFASVGAPGGCGGVASRRLEFVNAGGGGTGVGLGRVGAGWVLLSLRSSEEMTMRSSSAIEFATPRLTMPSDANAH
jgi:hypothetical protein